MTVLPDPPRPSAHDPIAIALAEDIGPGDLTCKYFVGDVQRSARIFAKESAVAAVWKPPLKFSPESTQSCT
jgi:nicotinate-nucleotide pyrophosphorylase (carboxylating)